MFNTKLTFTGVQRAEFQDWCAGSNRDGLSFITADDFFQCVDNPTADKCDNFVWLYRAPWKAISYSESSSPESQLTTWINNHKTLIKLLRARPHAFKIVNIDSVPIHSITSKTPRTDCRQGELGSTYSNELISMLFCEIAPRYLDVFESLESVAWFPTGEPIFRDHSQRCDERALYNFLDGYLQAANLQVTEKKLAQSEDARMVLQERLAYERAARYQAENDLAQIHEHYEKLQAELALKLEIRETQLAQLRNDYQEQESLYLELQRDIQDSRIMVDRAYALIEAANVNG